MSLHDALWDVYSLTTALIGCVLLVFMALAGLRDADKQDKPFQVCFFFFFACVGGLFFGMVAAQLVIVLWAK